MEYKLKNWVKKAGYAFLLMMALAVIVFAAAPTQTYLSDTTSYFKGDVGIGQDTPTASLDVQEDDNTAVAIKTVRDSTSEEFNLFMSSLSDTRGSNILYRNRPSTETAGSLLYLQQDHATDDQNTLEVRQDGTGNGLFIDQNGNGVSLNIDSEATTQPSLFISSPQTTSEVSYIQGTGIHTGTGVNSVSVIETQNAGSSGTTQTIKNEGTGNGLLIDQKGNGIGLNVDSEATTQPSLYVTGKQTSSELAYFFNDGIHTGTGFNSLFVIDNTNPSSTGNVQYISNDGTGNGLFIDQNNNEGRALSIDSEGGNSNSEALFISSNQENSSSVYILDSGTGANTFTATLRVQRTGASASPVIRAEGAASQTGEILFLNQDGNGVSLNIDSEATSNWAITANTNSAASYTNLAGTGQSNGDNWFYRNSDSGITASPVVFIEQDHATDDQNALNIQQDGTGYGLFIDQNGNNRGIHIDSEATTANAMVLGSPNDGTAASGVNKYVFRAAAEGAGGAAIFDRNIASTNTPLVKLTEDHASSTSNALEIQNDGTGNGLFIDQNGDGQALNIDVDGTPTTYGVQIEKSAGTQNVRLLDNAQTTGSNWFYRSEPAATTAGAVMFIEQDEATDDQNALNIQQDGTGRGIFIDQNANGNALAIDSEATSAPAISFDTSSGGCAAGQYGLYTDASNDLYWCKNGVSTKLN